MITPAGGNNNLCQPYLVNITLPIINTYQPLNKLRIIMTEQNTFDNHAPTRKKRLRPKRDMRKKTLESANKLNDSNRMPNKMNMNKTLLAITTNPAELQQQKYKSYERIEIIMVVYYQHFHSQRSMHVAW